ncbi:unnamed protein product [Calypogeia fissa]
MRNDANLLARSPRAGRGSFFPSSLRAISTYIRSVSANASNIASNVRSGVASPVSSGTLHEDDRQREQVQWAGFDRLEINSGEIRHVLLLTYLNGFQVWDVEEARNVRELVSRRDGPVSFLRLQPRPYSQESLDGGGVLKSARPLLLVVTGDAANTGSHIPGGIPANYNAGGAGCAPGAPLPQIVPTMIRFYSLQNHAYVHVLRFRTGIYAVRCSPRVVVVALYNQIYCFDASSLQNTFSVLTYPTPPPGPGATTIGFGAIAVGPRWLAYAANQPLIASTGRVSPQHLTPSPGISPSTSPANASLVAHYAKESSKHIAAGIVTLGDMGYKTISRYCSELLPDGASSPSTGSPSWKNNSNGHIAWQGVAAHEPPEYAGMIIVRDFVSKTIVAQFRAHTSPISALAFDPSGTLLVTASIYGHNLNVFRLTPSTTAAGVSSGYDSQMSYVHLYKLYRGLTNAVIQDISFSSDSQWIAVSSSRGTSHMFAISPFGGLVGPQTHGAIPVDGLMGPTFMPAPTFPWWSSPGSVRVSQQPVPPPPLAVTLSVVSRVKNGIGGWRGTMTGAAAAATGRASNVSGAVAAIFHDGGNHNLEGEVGSGCLKEQLWVLSPSGNLIRYLLRPSAGIDGGYSSGGTPGVSMMNSGSPVQTQELRLLVEPLEKWDVSRRPNWAEREERLDCLAGPGVGYEEAVSSASGGQWAGSGGHVIGSGNGLGKEGMSVEDMQRWFMSNAEVQHSQARPLPIWAKAKVYFHVMLPRESENEGSSVGGDGIGGEIEIERIPTRIVEVRRKDLVPVIERLQVLTKVQATRDMAPETIPAVSGLDMQLLVDDGLQEGVSGAGFGGMHIHRTSSGSSFGSEGGPVGGTINGFHHNYQDYPEISAAGTPPSSFESSPSFFHHSQQGGGAPSAFGRIPVQGMLKQTSTDFLQPTQPVSSAVSETGVVAIGSPPMGIPRPARREIEIRAGYSSPFTKTEGEVDIGSVFSHSMRSSGRGGQTSLENMNRELMTAGFPTEPPKYGPDSNTTIMEGNNGSVNALDGQMMAMFEQMGLEDTGTHQSEDSPIPSGHKPWDMGLDNAGAAPLVRLSSGGNSTLGSDGGPAFIFSHERLNGGQEESHVSFHTQDNGVAEDGESADDRSKSEDNEGGDPGDDVWEGAMFPMFCEEDS